MNKFSLVFVVFLAGALFWENAFASIYSSIESFFAYYPTSSFDDTPEAYGLKHKDVSFSAADGERLHGWLFPSEKKNVPIFLFCHGNAGNISHRLGLIQQLLSYNVEVFIFDYRGYGHSEGKPSEQGLYQDGIAAYDYLVNQGFHTKNIVLFGRSLGAAVAIETALQRPVKKIILEGAFTSTKDIAGTIPLVGLFSPLLPAHYNNLEKIEEITIPKLFIHGERDDIVPFFMGQQLFDAALDPKQLYSVPDAGHNDTHIVGGKEYFRTIVEFIER